MEGSLCAGYAKYCSTYYEYVVMYKMYYKIGELSRLVGPRRSFTGKHFDDGGTEQRLGHGVGYRVQKAIPVLQIADESESFVWQTSYDESRFDTVD